MKITKTLLLASASVMVLGFGATSAKAFDDVDWEWNKVVTSTENITVNIDDNFDISGLVEIEKIQMNIGDVTANSIVSGITNSDPGTGGENGGGFVNIDETFTFVTTTDDSVDPSIVLPAGPNEGNGTGPLSGELLGDTLDEGSDQLTLTFRAFGEVEVPASEINVKDAVDLPLVNSVATAVANNQSINSTVATNLHDAQYNFGGFDPIFGDRQIVEAGTNVAAIDENDDEFGTGNTHTDILIAGVLGGLLGVIEPGNVSATSSVSGITDAQVNSEATAVGNNLSVNLDAATPGDAFLVADLTQFNYADVSASSTVTGVSVTGYTNLDALDGALVNSVATAVGNNVSITVNSPDVSSAGE
ncbi:MAG: hypothetical protein KDI65_09390 [Alphaproteobacteria bacterium]|nr:hypothetical protein [Alphaproteobacteria bacterium]